MKGLGESMKLQRLVNLPTKAVADRYFVLRRLTAIYKPSRQNVIPNDTAPACTQTKFNYNRSFESISRR